MPRKKKTTEVAPQVIENEKPAEEQPQDETPEEKMTWKELGDYHHVPFGAQDETLRRRLEAAEELIAAQGELLDCYRLRLGRVKAIDRVAQARKRWEEVATK